mmetsp:Transcript_75342/g.212987  ORF Transcript_75342/g.212987 Transcript_75342/m.212987 type:complete len:249 (+) Transcript_75342:277-1023(+)
MAAAGPVFGQGRCLRGTVPHIGRFVGDGSPCCRDRAAPERPVVDLWRRPRRCAPRDPLLPRALPAEGRHRGARHRARRLRRPRRGRRRAPAARRLAGREDPGPGGGAAPLGDPPRPLRRRAGRRHDAVPARHREGPPRAAGQRRRRAGAGAVAEGPAQMPRFWVRQRRARRRPARAVRAGRAARALRRGRRGARGRAPERAGRGEHPARGHPRRPRRAPRGRDGGRPGEAEAVRLHLLEPPRPPGPPG